MTATIERGAATAPVPAPPQSTATRRRTGGFLGSSNGKKVVMAVTGAVMVLFLLLHMLGNLKIFLSKDSFNEYAHALRTLGDPLVPYRTVLTILELVLVVSVVLHIWAAISLSRRAGKARPVKYVAKKSQANGYATHIMRYGGLTIALFVVWHLLDLTFGVVNPKGFDSSPADRMIAGFQASRWWVTLIYFVAVVMVGLHLRHGIWSAFQTLGWAGRARYKALKGTAALVSAVLVIGFLAPPLAITFGVVK
ncbi:succinate dehydrogenase cytochrome b subunit [Nonomuraea basaltis]|uniref:succinate dehydrogenase cytochrome b subunit n=1 Tax=Nonomuraea basaltis TaxID=2495887 RepID=UPI00110C40CE|nr:succinate dehydrogenase cytochrome b subunit [Nonomuraea basaltis]TMR90968.1 succinate dehydrogenase cytochrome b subunit [Nonomuraea basaltis]